jgi:hypothetical protein
VKRVLERAAQIDGAQTGVTVSDLTQAAHEAGISEKAMAQALEELLQGRQVVSATDPGGTTSAEVRVRSLFSFRTAAFGFLFVIVWMVIFFLARATP